MLLESVHLQAAPVNERCVIMRFKWQSEVERPWVGLTSESMTNVEQARAELVATVDALTEKLNIPVQLRHARERASSRLQALTGRHRFTGAMICAGMAAALGIVVFATIRTGSRR